MKRFLITSAFALAISAGATVANAQGWGNGYSAYQGYYGGINPNALGYGYTALTPVYPGNFARSFVPPAYYSCGPRWHDTTHLDYHPASVVRHGSHWHVIPGHYDVHRTGHWHSGRHYSH